MAYDVTRPKYSDVDSSGNSLIAPGKLPGSEINPSSSTNGWQRVFSQCNVLLNSGTGAIAIGPGGTNDTMLLGLYIIATAVTAATATLAGFGKSSDGVAFTAANLVFSGSTTVDVLITFPGGLVNNVGAMTLTSNTDVKVMAFWRPL